MYKIVITALLLAAFPLVAASQAQQAAPAQQQARPAQPPLSEKVFEKDTFHTSGGDLEITFLLHSTLMFKYQGKTIHVDPYSRAADYTTFPDADLILLTHDHGDHLDPRVLKELMGPNTTLIYTRDCEKKFPGGKVMRNGEEVTWEGIRIQAVPQYIDFEVIADQPHLKNECNGYILTFGDLRVYNACETVGYPEMATYKPIDIMFIAMDGIYNLTPEMAIAPVKLVMPKIMYPYHYNRADLTPFIEAFKGSPDVEVRIRQLQ